MNRKEALTQHVAGEVPDFDPANFVHGGPGRFTTDTVTIAARVYIQRHEIDTVHPMEHAHRLASAWLTANP